MKLVRGLAVTLAIVVVPVVMRILGAYAAVGLGMREVANASLGLAFVWADAIGPNPLLLFFWGVVGLALGQLTAERSLMRTVGLALVVVPTVAWASFVIAKAVGHHGHGGI